MVRLKLLESKLCFKITRQLAHDLKHAAGQVLWLHEGSCFNSTPEHECCLSTMQPCVSIAHGHNSLSGRMTRTMQLAQDHAY